MCLNLYFNDSDWWICFLKDKYMAGGSAKQTISGHVDTLNKSNNSFQLLLKEMAAIDVCEDQEWLNGTNSYIFLGCIPQDVENPYRTSDTSSLESEERENTRRDLQRRALDALEAARVWMNIPEILVGAGFDLLNWVFIIVVLFLV